MAGYDPSIVPVITTSYSPGETSPLSKSANETENDIVPLSFKNSVMKSLHDISDTFKSFLVTLVQS